MEKSEATCDMPAERYALAHNVEPEFWKKKRPEKFTTAEWELLCDGCGKCCLNKLETRNKIYFTSARCRFLNPENCLCRIYEHRFEKVADCRNITLQTVLSEPEILPKSCAYRLIVAGKDLPEWHPLVSGDAETVHKTGHSVYGHETINESEVKDYEDYIVEWPDL